MWALPSSRDRDLYRRCIERLAHVVGSEPFEPHITLVGSVPTPASAAAVVQPVVAGTKPFAAELIEVVDSEEYFRCVVLVVRPEGKIVVLRDKLVAALGVRRDAFWPHLSLLYADVSPSERQRLRSSLHLDLPVSLVIDAVCLVNTGPSDVRRWSILEWWPLELN